MKQSRKHSTTFVRWTQRQFDHPRRRAMMLGLGRLRLTYSRSIADDAKVVIRTVPVVVMNLDTGEWRAVNDGTTGRGLGDLVRFLARPGSVPPCAPSSS